MNLSFRHYYWRWLKSLFYLFLIFIILTTSARLFFVLYFGSFSTLMSHLPEMKKAFFLGLRFDLIPLAYVNAVPFILLNLGYFLPGKKVIKALRFLIISFLFAGYLLIAWSYVFDYGFYSYFQEHLNILFFGFFEDDTKALLISIHKNYNLFIVLTVVFICHFILFKLIKLLFSPFDFDLKVRKKPLAISFTFMIGLTLIAFLGRGNFTRLPLSIEDAHISENEFINETALNGLLTLNRAIKIRKTYGKDNYNYLDKYGFLSWEEAFKVLNNQPPKNADLISSLTVKTPQRPFLKDNPPHVVLVVMESFGSYWNEFDSEEFQILGGLKNHFREDILFKNFLPAENGTIGSIVSVATSQVIRPGARFLSESEYMKTKLSSSGHLPFKESGYETHFVYGGKLGWRDLGKYLTIQKYDRLWGADEIKEAIPELSNIRDEDLGNEWGIYDEYIYSFIDEQIRTATKPQLFLVLTTSNHPPFEYPSTYQPSPIKIDKEFLEKVTIDETLVRKRLIGLQYANQKASEFISKIKSSALGDKTIVAITGDHSFWIAKGVGQDLEFKRYAVPFYLSIPAKYKRGEVNLNKFGSHEDIFPTLYNLALSDQSYIKLGEDMLSENSVAINSSGLVANEWGAYHHDKFWKWSDKGKQVLEVTEETPELLELRKKSQAQISLTDLYLKSEKNRKKTGGGNGQQ